MAIPNFQDFMPMLELMRDERNPIRCWISKKIG